MQRHKHSLSHYKLLTADMGQLVPVGCMEVLPGDTFQQKTSALIRMSPMVAPVMHPIQVRIHHFFVPNRLVWGQENWEKFITGDLTEFTYPTITTGTDDKNTLLDYLGVPPGTSGVEVSALPVRAFNMIFDEYYRDQDLVSEREPDDITIPKCAWEKDYFSGARPWPQKGEAVTLPLGDKAPISGLYLSAGNPSGSASYDAYDGTNGPAPSTLWNTAGPGSGDYPRVFADLSKSEGVDINEFRRAFALQRYQEARARYGSRYVEYLRYLGVNPSDARLQRPEFLGGGKTTLSVSEVLRTGNDQALTTGPIGEMSGHGIAAMKSNRYRKYFEEHGHVLSIMSVRPKTMYQNGLSKMWSRRFKEDYYQKELETIGQQEIYENEVFMSGTGHQTVFGYADRYREYREEPSQVTSEFRNLLNYWHLSRDFASAPALNESFITCEPSKRIFAEQTQHSMWCMVNHSIQARRMVNKNANARII